MNEQDLRNVKGDEGLCAHMRVVLSDHDPAEVRKFLIQAEDAFEDLRRRTSNVMVAIKLLNQANDPKLSCERIR